MPIKWIQVSCNYPQVVSEVGWLYTQLVLLLPMKQPWRIWMQILLVDCGHQRVEQGKVVSYPDNCFTMWSR